ncbi:hypothetical protein [Actinopolymorpha pittospori]|uniref:hypothetical protein n=1 Tax=Actinopolymorpha pittospori TaxID=648752 RepID=UPI0031E55735
MAGGLGWPGGSGWRSPGQPRWLQPPARLPIFDTFTRPTLLLASVPAHVVAERLGHADPSIALRVSALLRQHAAGVADVFARAIEDEAAAAVGNGLSKLAAR